MEYLGIEAWLNSVRRGLLGVAVGEDDRPCEERWWEGWFEVGGVKGVHGVEDFVRLLGVSPQLPSSSSMTAQQRLGGVFEGVVSGVGGNSMGRKPVIIVVRTSALSGVMDSVGGLR